VIGDARGGLAALDACVRCGFCLQACPTYLATGDEADGPRGRIGLMRAMEAGEIAADDPILGRHLDRCLGCRGCEPVCPSGVAYGAALETARARLALARGVPLKVKLLAYLFAEAPLRRAAMRPVRWVRSLLARGSARAIFSLGMVASTRPRHASARALPHSGGTPVRLFRGCVMDDLFAHVHAATERVLVANGYDVLAAPGEVCCGALHLHAGMPERAQALAQVNALAFAGDEPVAVNSAGCGAALRDYGDLVPWEPAAAALAERSVDVSVLLAARGPRPAGSLPLRVAYDPPCHLLHAQRVALEPIAMLSAIAGIELVAVVESEQCCGAAGLYSLLEPELSRRVLQRKIDRLAEARPDVVVSGNPGCVMQLGAGLAAAGLDIPVRHPVELLDEAYAAAGLY